MPQDAGTKGRYASGPTLPLKRGSPAKPHTWDAFLRSVWRKVPSFPLATPAESLKAALSSKATTCETRTGTLPCSRIWVARRPPWRRPKLPMLTGYSVGMSSSKQTPSKPTSRRACKALPPHGCFYPMSSGRPPGKASTGRPWSLCYWPSMVTPTRGAIGSAIARRNCAR